MSKLQEIDILLVEDDACDRELIITAFKKQSVANPVCVAENGAEALDLLFCRGGHSEREIQLRPKVILLDLKLPKISGLEVLKTIKSDECTRSIPVVVLTSSSEDPDVRAAYEFGANSYVIKPVRAEAFIDTMNKLGLYWLKVNQQPR